MNKLATLILLAASAQAAEIISFEDAVKKMGSRFADLKKEHITSSVAHHTRAIKDLPDSFSWKSVDGVNYVTRMRNQHIPTYCVSCRSAAVVVPISPRYSNAHGHCRGGSSFSLPCVTVLYNPFRVRYSK